MSAQAKLVLGGVILVGAMVASLKLNAGTPGSVEFQPQVESTQSDAAIVGLPLESGRRGVVVEQPVDARAAGFYDIPEHAGVRLVVARVSGRVIDLEGTPVGGVEVCRARPRGNIEGTGQVLAARDLGCVTADAQGRFETEWSLPLTLNVRDDHYTTLFEGTVYREPDGEAAEEVLIIVAPRIPLGGVVIDQDGAPIQDVLVTVQTRVARAGLDLSASSLVMPEARTDAHGVFQVENAAAIDDSQIQFRAPGFVTQILPVPEGGDGALTVVLSRAGESLYTITGHVVVEDGSPATGALVSTGFMASPTDDRGFFVIDFEPWLMRVDEDVPTVVTAIRPGLRPSSLTLPSVTEARESGWPEEIVIELIGQPLSIRGIVVDEQGEPVTDVLVEPADMSAFGFVTSESLPAFAGAPRTQEELAGGGATYTDADGRFELQGLLDRSYSICAMRRPSLLSVVSGPVDAGDHDVRIVLDRRVLGTLEGRIVDRHGEGIPGVRVTVSRKRSGELVIGAGAVTDPDGAFRITDVTTEPEFLRIEGDAIVPELFRELEEDDDTTALELEVGRRSRLQFDWGDWPGREDELFVVDESGEALMMMRLTGNSIGEIPSITFQDNVTDVLVVSDEAAHAIVYRDGEEVTRMRLNLMADELNMIQL